MDKNKKLINERQLIKLSNERRLIKYVHHPRILNTFIKKKENKIYTKVIFWAKAENFTLKLINELRFPKFELVSERRLIKYVEHTFTIINIPRQELIVSEQELIGVANIMELIGGRDIQSRSLYRVK